MPEAGSREAQRARGTVGAVGSSSAAAELVAGVDEPVEE
jgi:hypothetical protein